MEETAYNFGRILGALFVASLPSAYACYYIFDRKFKNKTVGIWGAIGCGIMGFVGGLIYALPTLGLFAIIGKMFLNNSESADSKNNNDDAKVLKLEKLHHLKEKGVITEDEFKKEKEKLLAS